jgi:HK97 family phage major capsid protein
LQAVKLAAVSHQAPDSRLLAIQAAATGANETVGSDGGFLVQTDFATELLRRVHETGKLMSRTRRRTITSNANGLKINAIDETSRVDGSRMGGIQAYWTGEGEAKTASRPKFRQMELTLNKLTGLYYATDELLQDTTALAEDSTDWFSEEFGFKVDDALLRGTGAGMPLGILGHAGTVSVAKETGQPAASILRVNLEKMYSRMHASSIPNSAWFINQAVWPALFSMTFEVGIGGVPAFLPPGGLSSAPFGMILGRPIVPIEQAAALGTVGDIIFADWNQYMTIEKGGIDTASSIHVAFLTDETVFRFVLRMDGQPIHNTPLTPYKGANTLASFVTLDTRA